MEIRPYSEGDEPRILDLFEKSFGKPMTLEFWTWRYKNNPFTSELMIHLMWDNDSLAGHYAVSPVEMNIGNAKVLTALSMTTMTHPSYAGKGIFSALAENLYTEMQSKNVDLVWGFPNANSHYGFIKNLQWKDIATVPFLSKKNQPLKITQNIPYKLCSVFTMEMATALMNNNADISISKTKQYLDWRYLDNPHFDYKIIQLENEGKNFVVFKVFDSFTDASKVDVDIMELHYSYDPSALNELLLAIMDYLQSLSLVAHQFNTWCALHSRQQIQLEKNGFSISGPVTFLSARPLRSSLTDINDYRKWDLGMGYSDVF